IFILIFDIDMYKVIVVLALLLPLNALGQTEASSKIDSISADSIIPASFKGDMVKYFIKTVKYPVEAQKKGIQGTVFVAFVIDSNGVISNPRIEKSVHESLDNESLRVIRLMP